MLSVGDPASQFDKKIVVRPFRGLQPNKTRLKQMSRARAGIRMTRAVFDERTDFDNYSERFF